jgi:hypothetical protein
MSRDTQILIDPLGMNIQNRLDGGSRSVGPLELNSGLMLQGEHVGDLTVRNGPLVVAEGARLHGGRILVEGNMYVFGQIGLENEGDAPTHVECKGELHFAASCAAFGRLRCPRPAIYAGAKVRGVLETDE